MYSACIFNCEITNITSITNTYNFYFRHILLISIFFQLLISGFF